MTTVLNGVKQMSATHIRNTIISETAPTDEQALEYEATGDQIQWETSTDLNTFKSIIGVSCQGESLGTTTQVSYFGITGTFTRSTTESIAQTPQNIAGTYKNAKVRVTANASTTNDTLRLRKNIANGNIVITVTALTTGIFSDTTNTDSVVADDLMCWLYSQTTTGNPTMSGSVIMEFDPT